jgi:hypothetical protein
MNRERAAERAAVVEAMDRVDDIAEPIGERCRLEMVPLHQTR